MKAIKLLCFLPCFLIGMEVCAQNVFRDNVMALCSAQVDEEENKERMIQSVVRLKVSQGVDKQEAVRQAEDYYEHTYKPRLYDFLEQHYRKYLSEEDLLAIIAHMQSPGLQLAYQHISNANTEKQVEWLNGLITESITALLEGRRAKPVRIPKVSASYDEKFASLYQHMNLDKMITLMYEGIVTEIPEMDKAMKRKIQTWFQNNGKNIVMSLYAPVVTEEDLDRLVRFYTSPEGIRMQQANESLVAEMLQFSLDVIAELFK